MKDRLIRIRTLAAAALAAASLLACGGGGSSTPAPVPPPTPPVKLGTISVAVINKHVCDFEAVNVTYAKFRVSKSTTRAETNDPSWVDVPVSPPRKINLVNLTNGALEVLGQASVEVGHYTQLAVVLDTGSMANTIVTSAGESEEALDVPVAFGGMFVNDGFDVVEGQKTDIVLDVDACRSVYTSAQGKLSIGPSFYPMPPAPNGIKGLVPPAALANHVLVMAYKHQFQPYGWASAAVKPDPATGEFWLSHLEPGDYDVVITADNSAATMVASVPVDATTIKVISTPASPIPLAPSKMGSISGSLSFPFGKPYGGAPIEMYASQQFAPDHYAAVGHAMSDVPAYTFTLPNLPRAAPLFALYTSTLPLNFTSPSTFTYQVRTTPTSLMDNGGVHGVDISTGDKSGINLVLIPTGP